MQNLVAKRCALFLVAFSLLVHSNADAQELRPIVGSDFYCIELSEGSNLLGELKGDQVVSIAFEDGLRRQRKSVENAKNRLKATIKVLQNKELSRANRKFLTKAIAKLATGSARDKIFLVKLKKEIKRLKAQLNQARSHLTQMENCQEGDPVEKAGNVDKVLFVETLVDPTSGDEIIFSGVYISTKYPKKVKKKDSFLTFDFCTQFSSPDARVNAVGARSPSEGAVPFTSNLCSQDRAPRTVKGIDCTSILPKESVGRLLVGNASAEGPSDAVLLFYAETTGTVSHFIRNVPKKGCSSASF